MKTTEITVRTGPRPGVFDITAECERFVASAASPTMMADPAASGDGLLNVFVLHATCGVVVMELGAGSEDDLLATLENLLPHDDRWRHRHGSPGHGADHVLPLLAPPSITIPVVSGRLTLGTWQSIAIVDPNADNTARRVRLSFLAEAV